MGNIATRNDQNNKLQTTREARVAKAKTKSTTTTTSTSIAHNSNDTTFVDSFDEFLPNQSNNNFNNNTNNVIVPNAHIDDGNNKRSTSSSTKPTTTTPTATKSTTITSVQHKLKVQHNSEESAADSNTNATTTTNRLKQISSWSLGSLNLSRLNWSFTGANRKNSFRNRNKSIRKSLTTLQQEQRRSKTTWHKPLTNAIFATHFKESNRNDQYYIEHLIAKGAFGVVFKVIDKKKTCQANSSSISSNSNNISNNINISYKNDSIINQDNKNSLELEKAQQYSAHLKTNSQQQQSQPNIYALKVLKKSKIIEENSVQQIKDEADIQKLCGHHPFIVQQIDSWQNRRNLHILTEYMPNGELFSKISTFSIDLIRLYIAEIALAIDFLHHAGVIYRDAKPENILLTHDFHIKLTDFGLSKWLKLGATTKTMCGTFQFMGTK